MSANKIYTQFGHQIIKLKVDNFDGDLFPSKRDLMPEGCFESQFLKFQLLEILTDLGFISISFFRAWIFWAETALYGGQTFAMAFTTMTKRDWQLILEDSKSCEAALNKFPEYAKVETIGNWTKEFYGKNWESDQNIITAQLIKNRFCTLPKGHRVSFLS